jgi:hypothetical protein
MGRGTRYFCAAAEFIASAAKVTVSSRNCHSMAVGTHLRSALQIVHLFAPNVLKICPHSSSCIVPVLALATRREKKV